MSIETIYKCDKCGKILSENGSMFQTVFQSDDFCNDVTVYGNNDFCKDCFYLLLDNIKTFMPEVKVFEKKV